MTWECHKREDPVERLVTDCTAAEFVQWLVKSHNLPEGSAKTVEMNLREQFRWHRLQGRLDTHPTALVVAQLLGMRADIKKLERPEGAY